MIVLMVAAGKGERLGMGAKGFIELGQRPMIEVTARGLEHVQDLERAVAVVPEDMEERAQDLLGEPWEVIKGGPTRMASVECAVQHLKDVADKAVVMVHDGARPFASRSLFERLTTAFMENNVDLVAPCIEPTDAVKFMGTDSHKVVATIGKERVRLVQTPQITVMRVLRDGLAVARKTGRVAGDEAQLVEWLGGEVLLVAGEHNNFKITNPFDLQLARLLIGK